MSEDERPICAICGGRHQTIAPAAHHKELFIQLRVELERARGLLREVMLPLEDLYLEYMDDRVPPLLKRIQDFQDFQGGGR